MRLLLLAVLALAAVALGATREPHEGCDYDFGAGNGTAYLIVNNPYNLMLPLNIIYHSGKHNHSEGLSISSTRVIVFCGLGHGWLYIQQHESPLRSPLAWYPLAVPRYVVLRAGESATMSVTTLFAPAATIAAAFLLLVAFTLRPRLRRSAIYALPDALRDENIRIKYFSFIFIVLMGFLLLYLLIILLTDGSPLLSESLSLNILEQTRSSQSSSGGHVNDSSSDPLMEIMVLLVMYITLSLGGFYLSFHRGLRTYYYIFISILINLCIYINYSKSLLSFLPYTLFITILLTSSITLLSFYNLLMVSFLSAYGIATFIYYDANFGRPITWSLPLQIPAIIPEIWAVIFPVIAAIAMSFLFAVIMLTYGIDLIRGTHAVAPRTTLWPPLWWWFGLGVFALDELKARSLLHRLSASGGVVVELPRGGKAIVVSADLYGMYLCRLGREGGVCNDVEWVRYGEVRFKVSKIIRIIKRSDWHVVGRFIRKVVLPILADVLAFFMIKYIDLVTILTFLLFLILFLFVYHKYNDFRELKEYIQAIKIVHLMSHIFWAFILLFIFAFLTSDLVVSSHIFFIAAITSFLSRADPELSRYLFPWLELRLMCVDGSVIGLARGGCLQWAKGGGAPRGRAFVIRDGDCLVVVSPYVDNVRSRLQRYLCGPACPPVRIVGGEGVAVGVLDLQRRRYYYYVVDSSC
ncbi:MAG: hypothetical protein GU356_07520 [Pyrobaculum sp.]|nr:hypothetical protein [Pyrobaculum sp.]